MSVHTFSERLAQVRARIEEAARRSGRAAKDIVIVGVTKGFGPSAVQEAREAGLTVFGENKIQEAVEKIPQAPADAEWHMVGHLQSNKIPEALRLFKMIQSVDSVRLAEKIQKECEAQNKEIDVLLEINLSGEGQRYGFKTEEVYSAAEEILASEKIRIKGVMGIAPLTDDAEIRRKSFKALKNIFGILKTLKKERLEMKYLSMGMSDDFEIAVEEGANMLRLGRVLFGERL